MALTSKLLRPDGRRRGGDRGDILIEVLVVIVLLAITFSSFGQSAISANVSQRTAQYTDIATQFGQGVIEKAKSLQWKSLGFTTATSDYRAVGPAGQPTVNITDANVARVRDDATGRQVPALKPLDTVSAAAAGPVKNLQLVVRTDVTWKALSSSNPSTPSSGPIPTDGSAYYAKQITVTVTWTDSVKVPHSIVLGSTRAPTVSEAVPVGIANPTGPGNYVYPTITAASMGFGSSVQLAWSASPAYTTVIVERSATSTFTSATTISSGVTAGTTADNGGTRGQVNYYRVRAMTANGQAVASDPVAVFLQPTLAWSSGDLTWSPSFAASGYTGTLQMSSSEFGTSGATTGSVALAGQTSVPAASLAGYNYFQIKFTGPAGDAGLSNEVVRTTVSIQITKVTNVDNASITVAFDHSAASVGVSSLILQLCYTADCNAPAITSSITAASATTATQSITALATPGVVYARVGYQDASGTKTFGDAKSFKKYKDPTYTATTTNTGNVTITLGSGQTIGDWANTSAATAMLTVTPAGGTAVNKTITAFPSTQNGAAANGVANALKLVITTSDGTKITATGTASVTPTAMPSVSKFTALTGSSGTYTISQAPTTWAGSTSTWALAIGVDANDAMTNAKATTAASVSLSGTTTSTTYSTNVGAPYVVVIVKVGTTLYYGPAKKYR
ncbi:hypothetical protein GCM10025867_47260 (plasmid) [Frondihabitans sucicola]|uniref:Prepilin-type N-terminal cleavage/methylation domain-containing protein n=1 Tax=Frondihabitans sucicola TaxID=1268041 RepID=A0ABN6Y984_9MICO|nr:hypothetical protein [Frondihabitans sucicola]BDZ52485.1 hypothetical protein GCM10025867_47260 [Frondihabitans sucicola]